MSVWCGVVRCGGVGWVGACLGGASAAYCTVQYDDCCINVRCLLFSLSRFSLLVCVHIRVDRLRCRSSLRATPLLRLPPPPPAEAPRSTATPAAPPAAPPAAAVASSWVQQRDGLVQEPSPCEWRPPLQEAEPLTVAASARASPLSRPPPPPLLLLLCWRRQQQAAARLGLGRCCR